MQTGTETFLTDTRIHVHVHVNVHVHVYMYVHVRTCVNMSAVRTF